MIVENGAVIPQDTRRNNTEERVARQAAIPHFVEPPFRDA
jgi:hypothetical protein